MAPWVAGVALLAGLTGRWLAGSTWIGLAVLAAGAIGLAAFAWVTSRSRPTTDATAFAVDADAGLAGELRSAHWFESRGDRDAWADFHVGEAAAHAQAVDWVALYPRAWSGRTWAITALCAVGVVALAVRAPAGSRAATETALFDAGQPGADLPLDLQQKLARLMAQLDDVAMDKDAKAATLADLKDLMASLDPAMQKKLAEALEKHALGAQPKGATDELAKAEKPDAAQNATQDLPDDVKWALENMAAKAAQTEQGKPSANDPAAPTQPGEAGKGTLQSQAETGAKADQSAPIMREAASDEAGKKMIGGGGPMGGDSQPGAGKTNSNVKGAAEALLVAQALRKELLEANADALGDNVDKEDLRRKTEQGASSLGFTRAATPRTYEPSRATPPPSVPEARRSLLYQYFIRR
jgi:hypothetical protein